MGRQRDPLTCATQCVRNTGGQPPAPWIIVSIAPLSLEFLSHKMGLLEQTYHRETLNISAPLEMGKGEILPFKNHFGWLEVIALHHSLVPSPA